VTAIAGRIVGPTRLTFQIHRFETSAVVVMTVLSVIVSAAVIAYLRGSGYAAACLGPTEGDSPARCFDPFPGMIARIAAGSAGLAAIFPFIAGLLLGGPVIAGELDGGTARLAWSLSPSRLRWFGHRVLPVVILLVVAAFVIGAVSDQLLATLNPTADLARSFIGFHSRGVILAADALVVGAFAIALGALLGRPVPTFVLGLILSAVTIVAVGQVHRDVLAREAIVLEQSGEGFSFSGNDLFVASKFRDKDGSLIDWEQAVARYPEMMSGEFSEPLPIVELIIPGERYQFVEAREAAALSAIGLLAVLTATAIVLRRKPS
jgi:hypothetical protein